MFERYTEKARRVVFFARFEASQYGSQYIETEHLLLGVIREDPRLANRFLPTGASETIRQRVDSLKPRRTTFSTSIDIPLSKEGKSVLRNAADEADRMAHNHIGTEHLLLGLFGDGPETAAVILRELGVNAAELRKKIAETQPEPPPSTAFAHASTTPDDDPIQIHGASRDAAHIHSVVAQYQRQPWHWRQEVWLPRDVVIYLETGQISFDLSLANDIANFKIVKDGWASDNCVICHWRLFESSILSHGTGYTNGRDWLCTECYERFFVDSKPGPPPHPEIT